MTVTIELPEEQVAALKAKAAAEGLTLEDWFRKLAHLGSQAEKPHKPFKSGSSFVFPSSSDAAAEDEYSRIRKEIVASGLPMLGDDEVRAEILERKGVKGDTDS